MQVAFKSVILILLAVVVSFYRAMVVPSEGDRRVLHHDEVSENLQHVPSSIETIKSSYLGCLLTGKEFYRESYRGSISSAERDKAIDGGVLR